MIWGNAYDITMVRKKMVYTLISEMHNNGYRRQNTEVFIGLVFPNFPPSLFPIPLFKEYWW